MSDLENERWSARKLQEITGYKSWESVEGLITKTVQFLLKLEIPFYDNIKHIDGEEDDFHLSKFSVFVFLLLADSKKASVSQARKDFAHKYPYVSEVIPYLFENDFFTESLLLASSQINEFLNYIDTRPGAIDVLLEKNQFLLIDFLLNESVRYKEINE